MIPFESMLGVKAIDLPAKDSIMDIFFNFGGIELIGGFRSTCVLKSFLGSLAQKASDISTLG